jgi:hypothetical protein
MWLKVTLQENLFLFFCQICKKKDIHSIVHLTESYPILSVRYRSHVSWAEDDPYAQLVCSSTRPFFQHWHTLHFSHEPNSNIPAVRLTNKADFFIFFSSI